MNEDFSLVLSEFSLAVFLTHALLLLKVYLHPLVGISVPQNLLALSSDSSAHQGLPKNLLERSHSGQSTWITTKATVSLEVLQITVLKCVGTQLIPSNHFAKLHAA